MVQVVSFAVLLLAYGTTVVVTYFTGYKIFPHLGENGKFIVGGTQRLCYVCPTHPKDLPRHYYDDECFTEDLRHLNINGSYAFCNERYGTTPGCSSELQPIYKGFWDCNIKDSTLHMTVYKTCRAVCHEGYRLNHKNYAIRCGEDLKLNDTLALVRCVNLTRDCPVLPFITSGSWNCTYEQLLNGLVYEFTLTCRASCDLGLQLSHDLVVVCRENLTWTNDYSLPICEVAATTKIPDPLLLAPDTKENATSIEDHVRFGQKWWHILVLVAAVFLVVLIVLAIVCGCWKTHRKSKRSNISSVAGSTSMSSIKVSNESLQKRTTPETGYGTASDRGSSSSEQENTSLGLGNMTSDNLETHPSGTELEGLPLLPENTVDQSGIAGKNVTLSGPSNQVYQENLKGKQSQGNFNESKPEEQNGVNTDSEVCPSLLSPLSFDSFPSLLGLDTNKCNEENGPLSFYDPSKVARSQPAGAATDSSVNQSSSASKNSDNKDFITQAVVPQLNAESFLEPFENPSACVNPSSYTTNPQHSFGSGSDLAAVHGDRNLSDSLSAPGSLSQHPESTEIFPNVRNSDNRYGQTTNSHLLHDLSSPMNLPSNRYIAEVQELDLNHHIIPADQCGAETCSMSLADFKEDPSATECLETLDLMLTGEDLNSRNMNGLCHWMLHGKKENVPLYIKNCWKLSRGVPGNGPFSYIVNNDLVPLGFCLGHIVFYFNLASHRREDIIKHIRKCHPACHYCKQFYDGVRN